jgi:predicted nucleic acid-binding protein
VAVFILDASVVIEYLITGPYTNNAKALLAQATNEDRLIVPEFCLVECTNVIWKQVRFQGMSVEEAQVLLRDLRKIPLVTASVKSILNMALKVGLTHNLSVYDSVYVALASRSKSPLVTIDTRQSNVANLEQVVVKPLTDFIA